MTAQSGFEPGSVPLSVLVCSILHSMVHISESEVTGNEAENDDRRR